MDAVSVHALLAASAVMFVGALVQGSVGFGLNLLAAPILVLIDPRLVPGPAIASAFVLTVLVALRDRAGLDRRGVAWALVGRVPGTILGGAVVASLSARWFSVALATAVLTGVAFSLAGWHPRQTPSWLMGAGALSGLMGTVSSVGGPPMAFVYQRAPGPTIRASLSAFFVVGSALSVVSLAAVGRFGGVEAKASLALVPALVAGFALSHSTARFLDGGHTRRAVLTVSAASAVIAIVKALA